MVHYLTTLCGQVSEITDFASDLFMLFRNGTEVQFFRHSVFVPDYIKQTVMPSLFTVPRSSRSNVQPNDPTTLTRWTDSVQGNVNVLLTEENK